MPGLMEKQLAGGQRWCRGWFSGCWIIPKQYSGMARELSFQRMSRILRIIHFKDSSQIKSRRSIVVIVIVPGRENVGTFRRRNRHEGLSSCATTNVTVLRVIVNDLWYNSGD